MRSLSGYVALYSTLETTVQKSKGFIKKQDEKNYGFITFV